MTERRLIEEPPLIKEGIPRVDNQIVRYVEKRIPKEGSGLEYELYAQLLGLWSIRGEPYGRELVIDMLTSREGLEKCISGTPSAGKTTVRQQLKEIVETKSFETTLKFKDYKPAKVLEWTFDGFMRGCVKRYGPVRDWSGEIYDKTAEEMIKDVEAFRNSVEAKQLRNEGFVVHIIYEIPNAGERELGRLAIEKLAKRARNQIKKEGYSKISFLQLLQDERVIERGIDFRQVVLEWKWVSEVLKGKMDLDLLLEDELHTLGFYVYVDASRINQKDLTRVIYLNVRRMAPPEVIRKMDNEEREAARKFYWNITNNNGGRIDEIQELLSNFLKFSSSSNTMVGLPPGLYDYLSTTNENEIYELALMAAYYSFVLKYLGDPKRKIPLPEKNFAVLFNQLRLSKTMDIEGSYIRLDPIENKP